MTDSNLMTCVANFNQIPFYLNGLDSCMNFFLRTIWWILFVYVSAVDRHRINNVDQHYLHARKKWKIGEKSKERWCVGHQHQNSAQPDQLRHSQIEMALKDFQLFCIQSNTWTQNRNTFSFFDWFAHYSCKFWSGTA